MVVKGVYKIEGLKVRWAFKVGESKAREHRFKMMGTNLKEI